ncbi:MAG: FAD-dependent oxidoreductase [Rhodobacteraceae bacterium]|nr:FAD-dependent oxidoreductase [Paracoccaceae bacterium]
MGGRADRVVVIGAGIAGVSAAIWLQRKGCEAVLIDRQDPGEGASFGNAGVLAVSSVVPVTTPGLALKVPGYLLNPDSPLFVIWRNLPVLGSWLVRYLLHANDRDTRRIAAGLADIVGDSVEQHQALAAGTEAEKWLRGSDYIFAYRSRAEFEKDGYVWSLRREAGIHPIEVEASDVRAAEPALGPDTGFLALLKDHGFVSSPGNYVKSLAAEFVSRGGEFRKSATHGFAISRGRVTGVETDSGTVACDAAVLAAGIWSRGLLQGIGVDVPVQSERGYHILLKNPTIAPKAPVMVADGKFVATPMRDGLRCAGLLEFGSLSQPRSKAPLAYLRRKVRQTFPELEWAGEDEWMGHRPAPSDSLPLIGETGGTGIFTAFGHHHIGLTGGPKTGRIVADLVAGDDPGLDAAMFSPNRFR